MSIGYENARYITIISWMSDELNLRGNELMTYAIIYGFSQDNETKFYGSRSYIANWLHCSLPTVDKALTSLIEKNLIIKETEYMNGVKFNRYKSNLEVVKNLCLGSKETLQGDSKDSLQGVVKKLYRGSKETLHNNIYINNNNKYIYSENENDTVVATQNDENECSSFTGKTKEVDKASACPENFELIWARYPRKQGKEKAYKYYLQLRNGKKYLGRTVKLTNREIFSAVSNYATKVENENIEARYIQMGSTFFNNSIFDYVESEEEEE